MSFNSVKTVLLLALLGGLLLFVGKLLGGYAGLQIALVIALVINIGAYFFSDKIVLSMYKAQPLDRHQYKHIYDMVEDLCSTMHMPMPKLWLINTKVANAFATGRSPQNGSVALTTGILDILNNRELRGVIAHELSHIKNRDVLIATIAATIATAISYLAQMAQYAAFWGGGTSSDGKDRRSNPLMLLIIALVMPIAAALIQLAISRSREYAADESGSCASLDPLALAAALEKLENNVQKDNLNSQETLYAATSSLFIVYPFTGRSWINLFSTHPPLFKRIARLQQLADQLLHRT
jgi:heat shock protein HtpX